MPYVIKSFMSGESFYKSSKNSVADPGGCDVWSRLITATAGSDPAEGVNVRLEFVVYFCDELTTRSEES
jgi:hypothetical protein